MGRLVQPQNMPRKSHPTRGEWIEIDSVYLRICSSGSSHPTRGEWIEIRKDADTLAVHKVSPHTG